MIKFCKTRLSKVYLIEDLPKDEDFRGDYVELYNKKLYDEFLYKELGKKIEFVQDDISMSSKYIFRGIHGDDSTYKLISCLYGKFLLVVLNYDKDSNEFGKWDKFILSDKNYRHVLVPPKFGNGHLILSDKAVFHYKQSTYYDPTTQFSIVWDDPRFNIWLPIKNPILSQRDELGHYVD